MWCARAVLRTNERTIAWHLCDGRDFSVRVGRYGRRQWWRRQPECNRWRSAHAAGTVYAQARSAAEQPKAAFDRLLLASRAELLIARLNRLGVHAAAVAARRAGYELHELPSAIRAVAVDTPLPRLRRLFLPRVLFASRRQRYPRRRVDAARVRSLRLLEHAPRTPRLRVRAAALKPPRGPRDWPPRRASSRAVRACSTACSPASPDPHVACPRDRRRGRSAAAPLSTPLHQESPCAPVCLRHRRPLECARCAMPRTRRQLHVYLLLALRAAACFGARRQLSWPCGLANCLTPLGCNLPRNPLSFPHVFLRPCVPSAPTTLCRSSPSVHTVHSRLSSLSHLCSTPRPLPVLRLLRPVRRGDREAAAAHRAERLQRVPARVSARARRGAVGAAWRGTRARGASRSPPRHHGAIALATQSRDWHWHWWWCRPSAHPPGTTERPAGCRPKLRAADSAGRLAPVMALREALQPWLLPMNIYIIKSTECEAFSIYCGLCGIRLRDRVFRSPTWVRGSDPDRALPSSLSAGSWVGNFTSCSSPRRQYGVFASRHDRASLTSSPP